MDIPRSKQQDFWFKFRFDERKCAYLEYWLTNHPFPSWMIIVDSLWQAGEYEALDHVSAKYYLKGKIAKNLKLYFTELRSVI